MITLGTASTMTKTNLTGSMFDGQIVNQQQRKKN
jgi:hypothetical protein